eukprot:m.72968 g.72968  ORF g.72968 m.72968 type:complete len:50 (+) comp35822_c0_seq2:2242-2391(+)
MTDTKENAMALVESISCSWPTLRILFCLLRWFAMAVSSHDTYFHDCSLL